MESGWWSPVCACPADFQAQQGAKGMQALKWHFPSYECSLMNLTVCFRKYAITCTLPTGLINTAERLVIVHSGSFFSVTCGNTGIDVSGSLIQAMNPYNFGLKFGV